MASAFFIACGLQGVPYSSELRRIALIIILMRAGLSMNVSGLKKVGRSAILMWFIPATLEILGYFFYCTSFSWNNKTWSFNNRSRSCSSFASRHSSKKDQTYRRRLRNKKTDSKDDSCRSKCRWCFCNRDFFNLHQHGTRKGNWCHKDCFHSLFS